MKQGQPDYDMSEEYRNRLADFLARYLDIADSRYGYGSDIIIRQGIQLLIQHGVYNRTELKRAALKAQGIVLTDEFIEMCLKGGSSNG